MALLAPSSSSLQKLFNLRSEYVVEYDMIYNLKKKNVKFKHIPTLSLGQCKFEFVNKCK